MGDKPEFRVGVAGLDPRDLRLMEIVFRHSQYNKYAYRLVEPSRGFDILIANAQSQAGERTIGAMRARGEHRPVIAVLGRGEATGDERAIAIDRLTLQLLPILNRVVELELASGQPEVQDVRIDDRIDEAFVGRAQGQPEARAEGSAGDRLEGQSPDQSSDRFEAQRATPGGGPAEAPLEQAGSTGTPLKQATRAETPPIQTAGAAAQFEPEREIGTVRATEFEPEPVPEPGPAAALEAPYETDRRPGMQ